MKRLFILLLIISLATTLQHATAKAPCGNNSGGGAGTKSGDNKAAPPGSGDPFNPYTGNEYREIPDLKIWGGVGEHQLVWERWANSRFVNGPQYFGNGHNWRHSYQWDMADAGTATNGHKQLEIIYPDGSDNIFTQASANSTSWKSIYGLANTLTQSGNDFYLQRENGWVYHFVKNVTDPAQPYYLMTDFKDSMQNDYVLTYNGAREVVQITEPGGRFIQINYTSVTLNKVDFTTLATVQTKPLAGQYTEIAVTDLNSYRYLRYLGSDRGYNDVAEVEFYDVNGSKVTGTPFGSSPASSKGHDFTKAFDGDPTTFVEDARLSGGYCGIDLGAGHSAVISKVRFYPRSGYEGRMFSGNTRQASGAGRFQGSNLPPATVDVIASVVTNDGRTVTYNYTPFNDTTLPYVWQTLTSVSYDDNTQATYAYQQIFASTQPLIVAYSDPRYELPFKKTKTVYYNTQEVALGQLFQQLNYDTGEVINTLAAFNGNLSVPAVTQGNGAVELTGINHVNGANTSNTDGLGHTTSYGYDKNGFKNAVTDALGRKTQTTNSAFANPLTITLPDGSIQSWTRDSLDLPLTATDQLGRTSTWTRDVQHRVTRIAYPDGSQEAFTYNSFGEVLTHTLRNGGTEVSVYDATGLKTSFRNAVGHVIAYLYDTASRLVSVTDARGNTTSLQYNGKGQIVQTTLADGSVHTSAYDTFGNQISDTDELNHTTSFTYDTFNRLTSTTDALGRKTQYLYRSGYYVANKPDKVILPSGKTTANSYDLEDNLLSQTAGYSTVDAATTKYNYDAVYNVLNTTDGNGHIWSSTFDVRDRKISSVDAVGNTTSYTYDYVGNLLTLVRPDGGVTTNVYNSVNKLLQTTDPKNQITKYAYDLSSNLISTTDARGSIYGYTYDALNRKTKMTYPDGSTEVWAYDPVSNVASLTTRAGKTQSNSYDSRNRLISSVWNDGVTPSQSFSYDNAGRLLTLNTPVSNLSYTYDNANEELSETQAIAGASASHTVSYSYDLDGNRLSLGYPNGTVLNYGYTNRNQLASLGNYVSYSYDLSGNRIGKVLANGVSTSTTLDADNRILDLTNSSNGTTIAQFDYGYDVMNRRTFEQRDQSLGDAYNYDSVDQVASVQYNASSVTVTPTGATRQVSYQLDATGNRTSVTDTGVTTNYSTNNLNQYTQVGSDGLDYDGDGNLINRGTAPAGWSYTYDAQNRLIQATHGSASETFAYDGRNRRVSSTVSGANTTYRFFDNWNLIEERSATDSQMAIYIHGAVVDEIISLTNTLGSVYYLYNALGSTTHLTSTTGAIVEKYFYDVYGNVTIQTSTGTQTGLSGYLNRFLFTGREYLAELNIYDYRNRFYDPSLGKFLQTDPLSFTAGDINIYRYVFNDIINFVDPWGLDWVYHQSTGQLQHVDNSTGQTTNAGTGYSGHGQGVNNPANQGVNGSPGAPNAANAGPIPQGTYNIGPQHDGGHLGPDVMNLDPAPGTDTLGRDAFRMHGDNGRGNQSASQGCIVMSRGVRNAVANSGDHTLRVVP